MLAVDDTGIKIYGHVQIKETKQPYVEQQYYRQLYGVRVLILVHIMPLYFMYTTV